MEKSPLYDLPKLLFSLLLISVLFIACFWIIEPFLIGALWALMVVIATWPILIFLQSLFHNKRIWATCTIILLICLIFIIPIILCISHIIHNSEVLILWLKNIPNMTLPKFEWLEKIPIIGSELHTSWLHLITTSNGTDYLKKIQPYIGDFASWLITQISSIGHLMIHLLLMIIFCSVFYQKGEFIGNWLIKFSRRIAQKRGETTLILAAQAIRAVALGIVVTALIQTLIGSITLYLINIPYFAILTVILFICCVAQLGPLFVLIPCIIWLYWAGHPVSGTVLLAVSGLLSTIDNILRPILIRKGANLPLVLVFLGVIGGLLAFGLLGLFLGPVILAISYCLLMAWIDEDKEIPVELANKHQ